MAQIPVTWNGSDSQGNKLRWSSGLKWNGSVPQPKTKPMPQLHVLLSFANLPDNDLVDFANVILGKLYGVPLYADPPVTSADLTTAKNDFATALAAAAVGGPADTANKNNKRQVLVDKLRALARHVEDRHGNNLAALLSSGFQAASTNRAPAPLDTPTIKDIRNGKHTEVIIRVPPVDNAKAYGVQYALILANGGLGPMQTAGPFTDSRNLAVSGLTPGSNYQFQVRAIGGSTGSSDWSDPVIHMSM